MNLSRHLASSHGHRRPARPHRARTHPHHGRAGASVLTSGCGLDSSSRTAPSAWRAASSASPSAQPGSSCAPRAGRRTLLPPDALSFIKALALAAPAHGDTPLCQPAGPHPPASSPSCSRPSRRRTRAVRTQAHAQGGARVESAPTPPLPRGLVPRALSYVAWPGRAAPSPSFSAAESAPSSSHTVPSVRAAPRPGWKSYYAGVSNEDEFLDAEEIFVAAPLYTFAIEKSEVPDARLSLLRGWAWSEFVINTTTAATHSSPNIVARTAPIVSCERCVFVLTYCGSAANTAEPGQADPTL
ncbi:hypothetical protein C8J57DRAFT_1256864 [Mycena rebaudengoi]|nr:hypothetical protein C8J57DRAFT_1256864 [Mycena rebaudengoi]